MQAAGAAVGQLRFAVCLVAYVLCASSAMVFSKARLPRPLHPSENPSRPHQLETLPIRRSRSSGACDPGLAREHGQAPNQLLFQFPIQV
jgi:hypothetical protein